MSKAYNIGTPIWIVISLTLFVGCKKEVIEPCALGYGSNDCKTEVRAKYLGTFTGNEPCSVTGNAIYAITITKNDADVTKVNFENLWDAGKSTPGQLHSDGNIYISEQVFYSHYRISGKAMILNSKLKISYTVTGLYTSDSPDNCIWQQQ